MNFYRRVRLFLKIVYRIDQSDTRMRPALAWEVAGIIHGQIDRYKPHD